MESLYEKLVAYGAGDACPFHMPGHKRNMGKWGFADPFSFDITEIDGFDNLHHAEGILKAAQERAARVYGARRTFFLINGSSAGILAAVSACVSKGGKLLMARTKQSTMRRRCWIWKRCMFTRSRSGGTASMAAFLRNGWNGCWKNILASRR